MAGSPAYLRWLDQQQNMLTTLAEYSVGLDELWRVLGEDWDNLAIPGSTMRPNETVLDDLATVCYEIASAISGLTVTEIINNARALHIAKNAGYAGAANPDPWANFRMSTAFGISPLAGTLVRMSDKYIRIQNLRKDPTNERVGESLIDTILDLAAYAGIARCLAMEQAA